MAGIHSQRGFGVSLSNRSVAEIVVTHSAEIPDGGGARRIKFQSMISGVDHLLPFLLLRCQRRDVLVGRGEQWIGSRSFGICGPGILRFQYLIDLAKLIPGFSVLWVGLDR